MTASLREHSILGLFLISSGLQLVGIAVLFAAPGSLDLLDYLGPILIGAGATGPTWVWAARRHR